VSFEQNISCALDSADDVRSLIDELETSDSNELRILACMLVKIEESLRSSVLLLSLGLLEDHFAAVRRHLEAVTVFVFVAGRGCFNDYMKEKLKIDGKKLRNNSKRIFDECPFAFSSRM
jgi:hypothetical protein